MTQQADTRPRFDPIKLEQLKVESEYPMEKEDFEELYNNGRYCDMAHINSKGYPVVTPMFYVILNNNIHISSIKKYRYKVHALEKRPKMTACIHNDGMIARHQKSILVLGQAKVMDDEKLREKIHWMVIDKYWFDAVGDQRQAAYEAIHTPLRAIIELVPEKIISWDLGKMVEAYDPGVWFNEAYNYPSRGGKFDAK